jgi:AcrR family transcriptional regulator
MNRKPDTKAAIINAAEAVVGEAGAAHLTLDAVAAKAGLSKGGLLYHFPTKEALLQSMLATLLDRVDRDAENLLPAAGKGAAADLRAHVLAGFQARAEQRQVSTAMLAAGANDPKLLIPVRAWQERHYQQIARTKRNPSRAAVVMLALDGLWLNELLQTSPLNAKERKQLLAELLELADSSA